MKSSNTAAIRRQRSRVRMSGLAALLLWGMVTSGARAATVLLSDTTLITGSESAVFSFDAPGPGTVSVQLTNLDWPQALSSLSLAATSANQVLWSSPSSQAALVGTQDPFFQVAKGGTYFADVMATAGGALDLGVYSLSITFTPAGAPVPLPASGGLLLVGILVLIGLRRATSHRPVTP